MWKDLLNSFRMIALAPTALNTAPTLNIVPTAPRTCLDNAATAVGSGRCAGLWKGRPDAPAAQAQGSPNKGQRKTVSSRIALASAIDTCKWSPIDSVSAIK